MRPLALVLLFLGFTWVNGEGFAPSMLWASRGVYGATSEPTVNYRTVSFDDLWSATVAAYVTKNAEENTLLPTANKAPELFVLFVSSQFNLWQLSEDRSASEPLRSTFSAAPSKFVFNNVNSEGPVLDSVASSLAAVGADVSYLGSCPEAKDPEVMTELKSILQPKAYNKPKVVVVCADGDLQHELLELQQVDKALKASRKEYVMMFVSEFEVPSREDYINAPQRRRTLKSEDEEKLPIVYDVCDDLCRTRVKFLEGIILALVLSLALLAGLCCMHILDTPTQFEKPEDADS